MNSSSERLFHLADTYESFSEMPGIFFKKWSYDKARGKISQARESSRASIPGRVNVLKRFLVIKI